MALVRDEGRLPGPTTTARVNRRDLEFELTSGRILSGPPALVGKWVCTEQLADILAHKDGVIEHLYTSDTEHGLRLARIDYLTAKRQEERGMFAVGSHVQYGKHGVFRVLGFDPDKGEYRIISGQREITVLRDRLDAEARVVEQGAPRVEAPRTWAEYDQPQELESQGSVEIDDGDLNRIVEAATRKWLDEHKDEIIKALANHSAEGGKDPSVQ